MSTYTSEPGTRLAGRYRLVDQVTVGNGWTMWKAIDETLARPVSVLTFAPGFPRISQVVTAARAASRLTDPRLAQAFDVEDGGGQAYIVLEWVGGDTLTDMLADGPLEPGRACSLVSEAARALAGAHAVGQAHLRLTPDALCWTRASGIKITGLGIDAALAGDGLTGPAAHDPAIADTIALAGLLYAALTGYWPGEQPTRLPAAPVSDGVVCTPRQVSADVSSAIDSVIVRALLQRPTRQGLPIQSPAAFADAIAGVAPPVPLPEPAPAAPAGYTDHGYTDRNRGYADRGDQGGGYPANPNDPDSWRVSGPQDTAPYPERRQSAQFPASGGGYRGGQHEQPPQHGNGRRGASRALLTVGVVVVLIVIAVVVWAVGLRKPTGSGAGPDTTNSNTTHPVTAKAAVLKPAGVTTFNPLGTTPGDTEDPTAAINAIDNSDTSAWATSDYFGSAIFGGYKPGVGLLVDMGKAVKLSQVEVLFGPGTIHAEIYLGDSGPSLAKSPTALSNFTLVSPTAAATGDHVFHVSSDATGRYVLIWLTDLPLAQNPSASIQASAHGQKIYQGLVYNVVVRGTAVLAAH